MKNNKLSIVEDLMSACEEATGSKEKALCAVRALCKKFGGQIIYIPFKESKKITAEYLRKVLVHSAGESNGEKMLLRIMILMGGVQIYIPMEYRAFRDEIAKEIYEKYDSSRNKMSELCNEHRISFAQLYRLWQRGKALKINKENEK
ncbi:MAG: hypothetical protein FWD87_04025 [Spirochaetaceae bacterium]|nr:hypothetical protein [Spirochaetaceae bacterium]